MGGLEGPCCQGSLVVIGMAGGLTQSKADSKNHIRVATTPCMALDICSYDSMADGHL
jgi:hypothetical protein